MVHFFDKCKKFVTLMCKETRLERVWTSPLSIRLQFSDHPVHSYMFIGSFFCSFHPSRFSSAVRFPVDIGDAACGLYLNFLTEVRVIRFKSPGEPTEVATVVNFMSISPALSQGKVFHQISSCPTVTHLHSWYPDIVLLHLETGEEFTMPDITPALPSFS